MDNTEQQNQGIKRVEYILAFFDGLKNKIPFSSNIPDVLSNLRAILRTLRPPRIMIIGRTRSGKSSLINAMCECKVAPNSWYISACCQHNSIFYDYVYWLA